MKFNYQFSNLCGTAYKQGNIIFNPDASSLYSPIGNRVMKYDLINHVSKTLNFEARKNIRFICLDPLVGKILIAVDVDGRALVVNVETENVLHRINFRNKVKCLKFSPCAKLLAVCVGSRLQIWKFHVKKQDLKEKKATIDFSSPLMLHNTYFGHRDRIIHVDWLINSRFLLTSSRDGSAKLFAVNDKQEREFKTITLAGHREALIGAYFVPRTEDLADDLELKATVDAPLNWDIWVIAKSGAVHVWEWNEDQEESEVSDVDESVEAEDSDTFSETGSLQDTAEEGKSLSHEIGTLVVASQQENQTDKSTAELSLWSIHRGRWMLKTKHLFFKSGAELSSAAIQELDVSKVTSSHLSKAEQWSYLKQATTLLVLGYTNGTFSLYQLPNMELIQELSVSKFKVNTATLGRSGEWLALGCADLGQIIVWEWQSETYVLKQQGHFYNMINCSTFSPNGHLIATGGDDAKIKVWSTRTGFSFVTFTDHAGPISCLQFGPQANVLISASLDGTVRAFDLVRYRNFRIMTSPDVNVQFTCCAIDPSGDLVCAGAQTPARVYVWRLKTGELMEVLSGHEGPITGLDFSISNLVSSSWDKTIRVWDIFGGTNEKLDLNTDVLAVKLRNDGKQVCGCGIDGNIYFFGVDSGKSEGIIEGARDISGGRKVTDRRSVSAYGNLSHFSSVSYTADGRCVIAAGRSKFICIYEVRSQMLLKKFQISCNRSLDGILDKLNSKNLLDAGPKEEMENSASESEEDIEKRYAWNMKGGDITRRTTMPEIRCKSVEFSPTNEQFIASTTEGLMIYALDATMIFEPLNIDEEVTPFNIVKQLEFGNHAKALVMSLRLGEVDLITKCYELVPEDRIETTAKSVNKEFLKSMLSVVAKQLEASKRFEFHLRWMKALLTSHSSFIQSNTTKYVDVMRRLQRATLSLQANFTKLSRENAYTMNYLVS